LNSVICCVDGCISLAFILFIHKYRVYADYVNMNWDQWERNIYVKTEWAPL